jgi:hypothetical protein
MLQSHNERQTRRNEMRKANHLFAYSPLGKRGWVGFALCATVLFGCSTEQQSAALGRLGDSVGRLADTALGQTRAAAGTIRNPLGASAARELNVFAKTTIGQLLTEADRLRAEEAAQRAIEQREAAAQQAAAARNAQTDQQLRADLAKARTEAERARAEQRAAESREAALREAMAQTQGPTVGWKSEKAGEVSGSAQALGPASVEGKTDCVQVREIAIIQGKEVRQIANFCRDPETGGRVRVV